MLSVFDIFKIGIGPSSSHTMGPMTAARRFARKVVAAGGDVARITVGVYGSLALTGEGHGTVDAILNGLEGMTPETVDPDSVAPRARAVRRGAKLLLDGKKAVAFDFPSDLVLHKDETLPRHTNGMRFAAVTADGREVYSADLYSAGGGFVMSDVDFDTPAPEGPPVPHPFANCNELLTICRSRNLSIPQIIMENELTWRSEREVREGLRRLAGLMNDCITAGLTREGEVLPGGLKVRRRAPGLYRKLAAAQEAGRGDLPLLPMIYAIAVGEENASGGRIVTAPTNGSAGIVPAVMRCHCDPLASPGDPCIVDYLLTAGAIGIICTMNASISGAEVGCQGEVGVACSMAAGGLCQILGGDPEQVEDAAEIAMEHNLGLTCDPVNGLVQIPCIERNGIAAEKAIKCAQLAYLDDGHHAVSLDQVIETMYVTGKEMQAKYKETSLGGLAHTLAKC